jgi:glycosyltransferase involved in cell wall biosynthesis
MGKIFNPKVSLVVPIYNGKNYMREAVDSAIAQTYENLEIILVNDGSKDNTHTICEEYQKNYPKLIKYFRKENGGVSTALNLAIKNMTGEYFTWLSHDDVYYPEKVETQVNILNDFFKQGKDIENVILYSDYELINEKGKHISNVVFDSELLNKKPAYSLLRGSINGLTLLIPKEAFDTMGTFDESLRTTQDYDLWMRFLKKYTFYHHPDVLTKTRLHKNQTTNTSKVLMEESNALWINICEMLNDSEKEELDGSLYNYYHNMYVFLETHTNYDEAKKHCENKLKEIKEKIEKEMEESHIPVTVVITYYNETKEELERAVKSVLNQTYSDIGIILINDSGDSDNEAISIIGKYKDNKNIRIIHNEENKGVSYSRNIGIENAEGKYIALLDCDDEFLPEKIEKQVYEMELSNAIFSHTSYIRVIKGRENKVDSAKMNTSSNENVISNCTIATPTVMLNKELVGDVRYREDLAISEDQVFYLELFRKNENYIAIEEHLSKVHTDRNTTGYNLANVAKGANNVFKFLIEEKYYIDHLRGFLLFTTFYKNILDSKDKKMNTLENQINYDDKTMLEKAVYHYRLNGFRHLLGVILRKILRVLKGQD